MGAEGGWNQTMRKYVCDNCGKETEDRDEIKVLCWLDVEPPFETEEHGEYCSSCREKIEGKIKEGIKP